MKILFVGDLNKHGRSYLRYRTLGYLGHRVYGISMMPVDWEPFSPQHSFWARVWWKLSLPPDSTGANREMVKKVCKSRYDVVWIDKGLTIKPSTLRYIKDNSPQTKLVSCSEDDMYARHNQTYYYRRGLPYYDVVFTTKLYNLTELQVLGAKKTVLFLDSYDSMLHCSVALTEKDRKQFGCDVGFIGSFEENRASYLLYLAEHGVSITVWGAGWKKWVNRHPNLIVKNQPLYGEDYVKAINATKINLCFLRKVNRDEITSRSVEIPACGGFMLAERTKRHQEFFNENKEAVFFDSRKELLMLVKKYLIANSERKEIAKAGRLRCMRSGYDMKTQLTNMLTLLSTL